MSALLAQSSDGGSPIGSLLFLVILGVLFYAVAILPNRRRMKAMQQVQAALAPGRRVMTGAGIFGYVVSTDGDEVELEIAPGVVVRVARAAVVKILDAAPSVADEDGDATAADEG